jgi:hypothetical protein
MNLSTHSHSLRLHHAALTSRIDRQPKQDVPTILNVPAKAPAGGTLKKFTEALRVALGGWAA